MATRHEPFRDSLDCPVVGHAVTISGELNHLLASNQFPIASPRVFGDCTGLSTCKIYPKGKPKPTGCPYYDVNLTSPIGRVEKA
jgi:hypothetical protein